MQSWAVFRNAVSFLWMLHDVLLYILIYRYACYALRLHTHLLFSLSRSFALHAWGNVLCPASGLPWALWNLMPFWSFCHLLSFHPEPCSVYNIDLAQSHSKFMRFTLFISIPTELVQNIGVDLGHRTASTAWCRKSTCLLQVSQGVYQESSWHALAKDIKHSFAREWW